MILIDLDIQCYINSHNYTRTMQYKSRIVEIIIEFWSQFVIVTLGTESYQFISTGTSTRRSPPYRSPISHRRKISHGGTMLRYLSDRRIIAAIAGGAASADLGKAVNRGVKESKVHDSWRASTSPGASEWILREIQRI
jgi:hypothetical protein